MDVLSDKALLKQIPTMMVGIYFIFSVLSVSALHGLNLCSYRYSNLESLYLSVVILFIIIKFPFLYIVILQG